MAIIKRIEEFPALMVKGKIGRPCGVGAFQCGWSFLGDYFLESGIYRRNGRWHNSKIVKMKHYRPTNPRTVLQQQKRSVFADGVNAWKLLTETEKEVWRKKRSPAKRSGFNRFMSVYMKNNS